MSIPIPIFALPLSNLLAMYETMGSRLPPDPFTVFGAVFPLSFDYRLSVRLTIDLTPFAILFSVRRIVQSPSCFDSLRVPEAVSPLPFAREHAHAFLL